MMNYRIRQIDKDDRFDTRVMELSFPDKKIVTPSKTIDRVGGKGEINEISLRVRRDDISRAYHGHKVRLNSLSSLYNQDAINVIIPEYHDVGFDYGNEDLLGKMESRIHTNSDIVVVPRWKGVMSLKNDGMLEENLLGHTRAYVEETRRLNGKLLMGNIPLNIPESVIDVLVDYCIGDGITSFVLDYGNSLPRNKEHVVRNIQKKLNTSGDYEESILYSTNVRRTHKIGSIYPADDLMTFSQGVDLIGNLHMGGGGSNSDTEKEPVSKQFIPSEYTYVERKGMTPKQFGELKVSNCRMQNEEAKTITHEIIENRSAYGYLKDRRGAKEYLDGAKQRTLDFGFL